MSNFYIAPFHKFLLVLSVSILSCYNIAFAQCGPSTPSFTANLVGCPTCTWASPSIVRADTCCGSSAPDKCLEFTIILDPNAVGINFGISSGAIPPGALYYQINCGPLIPVGSPICLSGAGPHVLTFCKPGNNSNTYTISSIPAPSVPDSILVRSGCSGTLAVSGFSVPTLNWTSVNPGSPGTYNSYLNCTVGCATVIATPTGTPPPFVDYEVSGYAASPCQANFYRDTVRVYFYSDLAATINPVNPTICFGSTNAILTATASGGLPAYTYSWSTGSTSQTVSVGPGTYTVIVFDKTGCPPTYTTSIVSSFTMPITANAGPDLTLCKSNPVAALNGTITSASGGLWSGGTGTISPSNSALSITYTPTASEITSGTVQLFLSTTGNAGCPPDADTILLKFQNIPVVNAGPDVTVCANNSTVNLSGIVSGFSNTGQWSGSGNGTFGSVTSLNTTYIPGNADISAGIVNIFLTSTSNGVCPPSKDSLVIIITPSPVSNAGNDQTICSTSTVVLNGIVTGATATGSWTTTGNGTFTPSSSVLNASYIPGSADISLGTVTLVLTSTGNGNCFASRDSVKISITKIAAVNAGPDHLICSTTGTVSLAGSISGGTGTGLWTTSGSGNFSPGSTSPSAGYNVSLGDAASGLITLTLTSTNNGPCPAVSDTLTVKIISLAAVYAGPNQVVCSNANSISLTGNVNSPSNTGIWQTAGTGTFNPGSTSLNTVYGFSSADINSGSVTFSLGSTANGPCPAIIDTVKISIRKIAVVNAGSDYTVCSSMSSVSLNGSVTAGSSSGIWSTSGSGNFSPGANFLSTNYNISLGDNSAGSVFLILSSANNGVCPAVKDTLKLNIILFPVIKLTSDTTICANQSPLVLKANVSGGSGVAAWATSGAGSFSPSAYFNPVAYNLDLTDITAGTVTLTINSINNGPCGNVSASIKVIIRPVPVADFSASSYTVYIPNNPITFSNLSSGAVSYSWDFGDGSAATSTSPNHNYSSVGYYTVGLVAINQYNCKDTVDKIVTVISDIQFPTAFTPNLNNSNGGSYDVGDYSNDVFFPYTSGVTDYQLRIFNRWGELIFESHELSKGWDGYFSGKLCQQDAYVWKADVKFFDGRTYNKTGSVTLLR